MLKRAPHDESKWTPDQARKRLEQIEHLLHELERDAVEERFTLIGIRATLRNLYPEAKAA